MSNSRLKIPFQAKEGDYVIITKIVSHYASPELSIGKLYKLEHYKGLRKFYEGRLVIRYGERIGRFGRNIYDVLCYEKGYFEFKPAKFTKTGLWKVLNE